MTKGILCIVLIVLTILIYQLILIDKFSPMTFVGDTNVSLLNQSQAMRAFDGKFNKRTQSKLQFSSPQQAFTIDIATSSAKIDYSSLYETFNNQHPNSFWDKFQKQILNIFSPTKISPKIIVSLEKQLDNISKSLDKPPQNAQITFDETATAEGSSSARIQIKEGVNGLSLDKAELKNTINNFLLTGKYASILPLKEVPPKITTQQINLAKAALENVTGEPIKLTFAQNSWVLDAKQLLTLLDLISGQSLLNKDQTQIFIKNIAQEIDQDVQEGLFDFNPASKRVTTFKPSQEGRKVDVDKTYSLMSEALTQELNKTINLPVAIIKPKIQTSDVNSLGIKELIGRGISNFAGSIPNRIYNVNLTASKITGILVSPGEIFSFNHTVGDITAATGFKQAYVIKEGRTVLDDGGGVCQDSTTLFRAVLNAGLPVIKRTAHAYRVGYYEQGFPPGLDATVFYPSVDFQFKNDTPAHILIQAYTVGVTLYVDLYGTSDGRVANLTTPIVTDRIPAPPDLRQDDPNLPKGVIKQVDWAAQGATVVFTRSVTRNSEVIHKEVWKSIYKPWQAVYLVGTKE